MLLEGDFIFITDTSTQMFEDIGASDFDDAFTGVDLDDGILSFGDKYFIDCVLSSDNIALSPQFCKSWLGNHHNHVIVCADSICKDYCKCPFFIREAKSHHSPIDLFVELDGFVVQWDFAQVSKEHIDIQISF